jgi:hypothetical protein
MLARVLSAAVNGIEAFPVEVEVNSGWGDTTVPASVPESFQVTLSRTVDNYDIATLAKSVVGNQSRVIFPCQPPRAWDAHY